MIHQIDSKNEWLLLLASFTAKLGNCKTAKLRDFILKSTERVSSSKNGARDFQNSPLFERLACSYMTISVTFERFQYFNF